MADIRKRSPLGPLSEALVGTQVRLERMTTMEVIMKRSGSRYSEMRGQECCNAS